MRTILVADANVVVAESFQCLLEADGWDVRLAYSPEHAELLLFEWKPRIALLDIEFQGSSRTGFDVLHAAKQGAPSTRIIMLSRYYDSVFPEESRRAGAAGFLAMTVHLPELFAAIRAVSEGKTWYADVPSDRLGGLTPRELQLVGYLEMGLHQGAIAETLRIKPRTVRFHLTNAERKTGAKTPPELVRIARERGWFLLPNDTRRPVNTG